MSSSVDSELAQYIERFQDYYEVEGIDTDEEDHVTILKCSLPYANPDWTSTDFIGMAIRLERDRDGHHQASVSILKVRSIPDTSSLVTASSGKPGH